MKFETEKYADVSTIHVKERDMNLLEELADGPRWNNGHDLPLYILTYKEGAFVRFSPKRIIDEIDTVIPAFIAAGFSIPFTKIIGAAAKQGIAMVRFDGDGQEVEGAQKFDW